MITTLGCGLAAVLLAACRRDSAPAQPRTSVVYTASTPVRVTMADLHGSGGVPPNWSFTLPQGDPEIGREIFVLYGCPSCHLVAGEEFSAEVQSPGPIGPELTGMGSHHPAGYFAESILNPDAIIVEGPGYTAEDGLSTMPAYPDLTTEQLTHLVAYLQSLIDPAGGTHDHQGGSSFFGRVDVTASNVPQADATPPIASATAASTRAAAFFVQTYSVREGELPELERWFEEEGRAAFQSDPDLLSVETHVDRTRGPEALVTVFSFSHMDYLREFLADRRIGEALEKFDDFAEVIDRQIYETAPVYRVGSLSSR